MGVTWSWSSFIGGVLLLALVFAVRDGIRLWKRRRAVNALVDLMYTPGPSSFYASKEDFVRDANSRASEFSRLMAGDAPCSDYDPWAQPIEPVE